ncbi:hypothetical protein D3C84_757250 [compost metagenome]
MQRQPDRGRDHQHRECIATQLVILIDDALHGTTHGIDAKRLEAHEDLSHLVELTPQSLSMGHRLHQLTLQVLL